MTPQELISLATEAKGWAGIEGGGPEFLQLCNGAIEIAASVELLAKLPCQKCERRKADTRERVAKHRARKK